MTGDRPEFGRGPWLPRRMYCTCRIAPHDHCPRHGAARENENR